eukprot:3729979-Prymnesium_polylepis.1
MSRPRDARPVWQRYLKIHLRFLGGLGEAGAHMDGGAVTAVERCDGGDGEAGGVVAHDPFHAFNLLADYRALSATTSR